MPYGLGKPGSHGCNGYPVVRTDTGAVVKCHPTKEKALAHLAALKINVQEKGRSMPTRSRSREYRQVHADYRLDEGKEGLLVADVLTYGVVDDYGTRFDPDVFTESLEKRMPRILWSHDWRDPIGRWVDYDNNKKRLRLLGELDLSPAVPSAMRAHAQLRSGTMDQFSVGFIRTKDQAVEGMPGIVDIMQGILDEASPVIAGAVPGTKLLAVRHAGVRLVVPLEEAQQVLLHFERGEMDLGEALMRVKGLAVPEDQRTPLTEGGTDDTGDVDDGAGLGEEGWTPEQLAMWNGLEPPEDWDGFTPPDVTDWTDASDVLDHLADRLNLDPVAAYDRATFNERRGPQGATSLPLSDKGESWDAAAATRSLQPGDYPRAFFWHDSSKPSDQVTSYKLPFARRTPGGLQAVWSGITAAAGALGGARGGVEIPDGDKAGVRTRIAAYYHKAAKQYDDDSIKPPWEK